MHELAAGSAKPSLQRWRREVESCSPAQSKSLGRCSAGPTSAANLLGICMEITCVSCCKMSLTPLCLPPRPPEGKQIKGLEACGRHGSGDQRPAQCSLGSGGRGAYCSRAGLGPAASKVAVFHSSVRSALQVVALRQSRLVARPRRGF